MHFGNPTAFLGLLIIPIVIFILILIKSRRRKLIHSFVSENIEKRLIFNVSTFSRGWQAVLIIFILILLIFAAARPQWGKKMEIVEEKAIDIVVGVDVSKSMLAEDIKPNRIKRAKNAFREFVAGLKTDRVGIILFAGNSFVQCPLTNDYSALNMFASVIEVGLIPQPGTNISSAISDAIELYPKGSQNRVLVLITDGENLQGDIEKQIKKANENNIIIYAIGVGTTQGAPIPLAKDNTSDRSYLRDQNDNIVLSKLDLQTLSMITSQTGGKLYQVTPGGRQIDRILKDINSLEKEKIAQHRYSKYKEQYKYFIFLALLLTIILYTLLDRKISAKFKLFRGKS